MRRYMTVIVGWFWQGDVYCPIHKPTVQTKPTCVGREDCKNPECHPQPIFNTAEGWQKEKCCMAHRDAWLGDLGEEVVVTLEEC